MATKKLKFTFKMQRPTGKWKSFSSAFCDILLNKNQVGAFYEDKSTGTPVISIRLMIEKADIMSDGNKNCPWKWITLVKTCASFDEAKLWVNENFELLIKKYTLRKY